MAGDFNIRNRNWDPSYHFHLIHSNSLTDIVDSCYDQYLEVAT